MARWRAVHPKIAQSKDIEALSEWAQLLWDRIVVCADDWGRLRGEAELVKAVCKPLSPRPAEDFEAALVEIEALPREQGEPPLLTRYVIGRSTYLQVSKWEQYQRPAGIHKRTASDFPAPPEPVAAEGAGKMPGDFREHSGKLPGSPPEDSATTALHCTAQREREDARDGDAPTEPPAPPTVAPAGRLPGWQGAGEAEPEHPGPLKSAEAAILALDRYRTLPDDPLWLLRWAQPLQALGPDIDLAAVVQACGDWYASADQAEPDKRPNWRARLNRWQADEIKRHREQAARARDSPALQRLDTDEARRAMGL